MLNRKRVFVLFLILILLISTFSLFGCAKKTKGKSNKTEAEYDTSGLPLTKAGTIKLMQGDWKVQTADGTILPTVFRNEIKDKKYLLFGNVEMMKSGNTSSYHETYEEPTEIRFDIQAKALYISRIFSGTTVVTEIRFISKNKIMTENNVAVGVYTMVRI